MDLEPSSITRAVLSLGVRPGDTLLCHSSYKSFGRAVAGGPKAVALALLDAAGPAGSLFLPTFNFAQIPWTGPATTPSLTGAITESFRLLPGVHRSLHPTHALAGFGPLAPSILADHEHRHPFGDDSPIWRLWKLNTWVLLLGVEHSSNSTIHVAEEFNRLPYVPRTRVQRVLSPDGQWRDITLRRPGDSNGFVKLDHVLAAMTPPRETYIASSRLRLFRADDIVRAATTLFARDPAALLCDDPACPRCAEALAMIAAADPQ